MSREKLVTSFFEDMASLQRSLVTLGSTLALHQLPTRAQFLFMAALSKEEGRSVKELAEHFCMSSSAATQLIDQLVEGGLVTRKEDEDDRRRISVSLTRKGKKILEAGRKARLARVRRMLAGLSDVELKQLTVLQQKIIHSLERSA